MQSGSPSSLSGFGENDDIYQEPYDKLVEYAGCANGTDLGANASAETNQSTFDCLKSLSGEDLLAAQVEMTSSQLNYSWG